MMNPETEISDLMSIVMPPTRLRAWLFKVFAAKKWKGEEVPEEFTNWLEVVNRICSDLPSEIDSIPAEQWAWIESKIFANRCNPKPLQPALINLASEKVVAY
jgi:hypothetical protein